MALQSSILSLFARSPIRPLQKHMAMAHQCAEILIPFFTAVIAEDWQEATKLQHKIADHEHAADQLKIDFRMHLPSSLMLPVSRTDLLNSLDQQEKIANRTKDIAGIVLGRYMTIPTTIQADFIRYIERCVDASGQAKTATSELDELLESGFKGKEVEIVTNMIKTLNQIEHETDTLQISIRRQLYAIEKDLSPVDVIFLYSIIKTIGSLADAAQQIGSRLRMLVA